MKKWSYILAGIVIGFVISTSGNAFASQVKSLVGSKVTAEYTVIVNGKELEDKGIVVNGRTNAPIRAISDAIGADLKVEGKTIVITTEGEETPITNSLNSSDLGNDIIILKQEREKVAKEITKRENAIKNYEEKYIPSDERAINAEILETEKEKRRIILAQHKAELETFRSELADFQKQLSDLDAQIAELEK